MPTTETSDDKRIEKRYEGIYAEYAVLKSRKDKDNLVYKSSFIRNFSRSGASLFVYEDIPDGALVVLRLFDPNVNIPTEILGGIVWKKQSASGPERRDCYDIGIKFLYIDDLNTRRLSLMVDYFDKLKPQSSGIIEYL